MDHLALAALVVVSAFQSAPVPMVPQQERLIARDGMVVAGRFYPAKRAKATILLFHQAGSSKDEYAIIAPCLAAAGYDALAIDQRIGGAMVGPNETATAVTGQPVYDDALPDLEAALSWARRRGKPVTLWGSSYSAALVFRLAAAHPGQVAAVLAFSPGEYLKRPPSVAASAAKVGVPVFVTSAGTAEEVAAANAIVSATRSAVKVDYVPKVGVHGSSTLIPARDPRGEAANWSAVLVFLAKVFP